MRAMSPTVATAAKPMAVSRLTQLERLLNTSKGLNLVRLAWLCLLLLVACHLSPRAQAFWPLGGEPEPRQAAEYQIQEQQQQLQQQLSGMSCFACSTMDYASPSDNLCRELSKRDELSGHQVTRLAAAHKHTTGPVLIGETEDSTHKRMRFLSRKMAPDEDQVLDDFSSQDESTTSGQIAPRGLVATSSSKNVTRRSVAETSGTEQVATIASDQQQQQQEQLHSSTPSALMKPVQRTPQSYRSIMPNNSIRLRPCLEDENFCSIVSVVRLEFVQDHYYTKFWALERNCSKSCNTGCMLIGERVRLRVCSQCCRTANCNVGGGSSAPIGGLLINYYFYKHALMLLLSLSLSSLATGAKWSASGH